MTPIHVLVVGLASVAGGFRERQPSGDPSFPEKPTNITVAEGRTATLPCIVENLGKFKLAWIHKDRHILLTLHNNVITRNPRISVHHGSFRSWWLEIREVKPEDGGAYMCQVNTNPMISQTTYLEVVVPPSIDEDFTSSDLSVREGADVSMRCRATGQPEPTIRWTREEQKHIILGGQKRVPSFDGEYLNLTRTSRLSMGAYLCIASNGVLPSVSKRIMLNVFFAPMILIPQQLVGAHKGEDITLACHLESFPRAVTYWIIREGIIAVNNNKYRVSAEPTDPPAPHRQRLLLLIRDLRRNDFESYKCVAKNSLGDSEGTIALYEKPSKKTTDATESDTSEDDSMENEVLREETRPIADNIRLERKERRKDAEKASPSSDLAPPGNSELVVRATGASFHQSLFIVCSCSLWLTLRGVTFGQ